MLVLAGFCFAETVDVTGAWYLNAIELEGTRIDPSLMGLNMSITLNSDGSAVMSTDDGETAESENGSWSMDGAVVTVVDASDYAMPLEMVGEELIAVEDGVNMVFGREQSSAAMYVPAPASANVAPEDFAGAWTATLFDMGGMQLPMEGVGMGMTVVFDGAKATFTLVEEGESETIEVDCVYEGSDAILTGEVPMTFTLLEDGKICYSQEEEGLALNMYFEKIA